MVHLDIYLSLKNISVPFSPDASENIIRVVESQKLGPTIAGSYFLSTSPCELSHVKELYWLLKFSTCARCISYMTNFIHGMTYWHNMRYWTQTDTTCTWMLGRLWYSTYKCKYDIWHGMTWYLTWLAKSKIHGVHDTCDNEMMDMEFLRCIWNGVHDPELIWILNLDFLIVDVCIVTTWLYYDVLVNHMYHVS